MPVVPTALAALVQSNVNSRMQAVSGTAPLSQKNPAYFIAMTMAIGSGIILGAPVINFTSSDTGVMGVPPIPGTGVGVGIMPDPSFLVSDLYTRVRGYIIADFGKTSHDSYPPSSGNSGEYLLALCNGINDAIQTYYPTAWTLASVDPTLYAGSGTISDGDFTGVVATAVAGAIMSAAPTLQGKFWPRLVQAISESYAALIMQHSTGSITLTGICVPAPPTQLCGIPSAGTSIGTAT